MGGDMDETIGGGRIVYEQSMTCDPKDLPEEALEASKKGTLGHLVVNVTPVRERSFSKEEVTDDAFKPLETFLGKKRNDPLIRSLPEQVTLYREKELSPSSIYSAPLYNG